MPKSLHCPPWPTRLTCRAGQVLAVLLTANLLGASLPSQAATQSTEPARKAKIATPQNTTPPKKSSAAPAKAKPAKASKLKPESTLDATAKDRARALAAAQAVAGAQADDVLIVDAHEAYRKGNRTRLAALSSTAVANQHPLAGWADYWHHQLRLAEISPAEAEAFLQRWPGTYVEDRFRNDWLLEAGRRGLWDAFDRQAPLFKMNDDREVACMRLHSRWRKDGAALSADEREALANEARRLWWAQKDPDEGCHRLAEVFLTHKLLSPDDVWTKLRFALELSKPRTLSKAAQLLSDATQRKLDAALDNPQRHLGRNPLAGSIDDQQLAVMAVLQLANDEWEGAADQLSRPWAQDLPASLAAAAWAGVGRQAAFRRQSAALSHYRQALRLRALAQGPAAPWSDDTLAWGVRAAIRPVEPEADRWPLVRQAVDLMSPAYLKDPAWVFWRARAQWVLAEPGAPGESERQAARQALQGIASPLTFYGQLAFEALGQKALLPATPLPLSAQERETATTHLGLQRGLKLMALGLRGEGIREWNFSLIGLDDRAMMAAAQLACDHEVWDRCINTSDRSKTSFMLNQRYPTPFKEAIVRAAQEAQLEPALVMGLIRQESRFMGEARSHVGASGLMQIMPATARWTAKKVGMDFKPESITQREVNLRLGTTYLKLVMDDFNGSAAMAAAAYNAGPARPRRWREGPVMDVPAWAENIPFQETRDYVKAVLANASVYTALLDQRSEVSLGSKLGKAIGPRGADAPPMNTELP